MAALIATAEQRGAAEARAGSGVATRASRSSVYSTEKLEPLRKGELAALAASHKIKVFHGKGKTTTKKDFIDALVRHDDVLAGDSDEAIVSRLSTQSKVGVSPLNKCYKSEFKPIDKHDQYKASSTSNKRRFGDDDHKITLHMLLAMGVNVFALHYERRGQTQKGSTTYENFIMAAHTERKS